MISYLFIKLRPRKFDPDRIKQVTCLIENISEPRIKLLALDPVNVSYRGEPDLICRLQASFNDIQRFANVIENGEEFGVLSVRVIMTKN